MNEKNNVLVIFYVIIVPRQQKNILRHNDRFIENGKSLSSNIFRKVVLNHKYQKNIHVAFINSVWFLADCRKIIKHLLSLDQMVYIIKPLIYWDPWCINGMKTSTTPSCGGPLRAQIFQNFYNQKCEFWPLGPLLPFLKRAPELIQNGNFQK